MAKVKIPPLVLVDGLRRTVVESKPTYWISSRGGVLTFHLGKLLIDGPAPTKVLDAPKVCGRCKTKSWAGTSRGRAVHDGCEGWLDTLPDDVFARVAFEALELAVATGDVEDPVATAVQLLAQALGATTLHVVEATFPASRINPRVIAGLKKMARSKPGDHGLVLRLVNRGASVQVSMPELVDATLVERLNEAFGPHVAVLRRSNSE